MSATDRPTTAQEWADRLDEEIGASWDAWSEACAAGVAGGVEILPEHPEYDEEGRQFASPEGWFVELGNDGTWRAR
jgi:hypothetical protein